MSGTINIISLWL